MTDTAGLVRPEDVASLLRQIEVESW
jgi:hypothetical protein